jgi:hypothetical protein
VAQFSCIGLAENGWGANYIPDSGSAETKRVARIFDGEIIELKPIEYPEDDEAVY